VQHAPNTAQTRSWHALHATDHAGVTEVRSVPARQLSLERKFLRKVRIIVVKHLTCRGTARRARFGTGKVLRKFMLCTGLDVTFA